MFYLTKGPRLDRSICVTEASYWIKSGPRPLNHHSNLWSFHSSCDCWWLCGERETVKALQITKVNQKTFFSGLNLYKQHMCVISAYLYADMWARHTLLVLEAYPLQSNKFWQIMFERALVACRQPACVESKGSKMPRHTLSASKLTRRICQANTLNKGGVVVLNC